VQTGIGVTNSVNTRSRTYYIAGSVQRCGTCARFTPVIGLVLFPGHETLESGGDADGDADASAADGWELAETRALLMYVEYLPQTVRRRLRQFSRRYRLEYDEQEGQSYWMNHCSRCGAQQPDFELYCEPEGAFMPTSEEAAEFITLYEFEEPFEARAGGYLYESEPDDGARGGTPSQGRQLC
jgi:hypothetical protein